MFEKQKIVDLSAFGYDKPAVVKRLTAGEKRELQNELSAANKMEIKGNEVQGKLSPGNAALIYAYHYYLEGPVAKDRKALETLDWEVIELIEEAGDELNSPFVGQKEKDA